MHSRKLTQYLCVIIVVLLVIDIALIAGIGINKLRNNIPEDTSMTETEESIESGPSTEPSIEVMTEPMPIAEPSNEPATEPTTESTTEPTESTVDPEDLEHLAIIIYREAGGDACCNECRRRVADVVLNRVADDRFENTIEDVLLSPHQFGKMYKTGITWPERASKPEEKHAVDRAYKIAEEVLQGKHSNVYQKGYVWFQMTKRTDDYIVCYVCGFYYSR